MKTKDKKVFSGLIVLIVLMLAVSIYILAKNNNSSSDNFESASESAQQAETPSGQNGDLNSSLPTDLVKDEPGAVSAIELRAMEGQSGFAKVAAVADGEELVLVIEADLPKSDGSYFAWLAKDTAGKNLQVLGKLEEKEGKQILSASVKGPLSSYKKLIISLETNEDNEAETVILEGNLSN